MALYGPNYDPNEIGDASLGNMQALYGGMPAYGGGQYIPTGWTRSPDVQSALQGARSPAFQQWAQAVAEGAGAQVEFVPGGAARFTMPDGSTRDLTQYHYDDFTKRGIDPTQALAPAQPVIAPAPQSYAPQGETISGPQEGMSWGRFGGPTSGGSLAGAGASGRAEPVGRYDIPAIPPRRNPMPGVSTGREADPPAQTGLLNPAASGAPGVYESSPTMSYTGNAQAALLNPAASGAPGLYDSTPQINYTINNPAQTMLTGQGAGAYVEPRTGQSATRYPTPRPVQVNRGVGAYAPSAQYGTGAGAYATPQASKSTQQSSSWSPKSSRSFSYAPGSKNQYSMYAPAKGGSYGA